MRVKEQESRDFGDYLLSISNFIFHDPGGPINYSPQYSLSRLFEAYLYIKLMFTLATLIFSECSRAAEHRVLAVCVRLNFELDRLFSVTFNAE